MWAVGKSTEGDVTLKGVTNICILKKMGSEQRPEDTMEIAFTQKEQPKQMP